MQNSFSNRICYLRLLFVPDSPIHCLFDRTYFIHNPNLGRDESKLAVIESYLRCNKMFRDYSNPEQDPIFSKVCLPNSRIFVCADISYLCDHKHHWNLSHLCDNKHHWNLSHLCDNKHQWNLSRFEKLVCHYYWRICWNRWRVIGFWIVEKLVVVLIECILPIGSRCRQGGGQSYKRGGHKWKLSCHTFFFPDDLLLPLPHLFSHWY